jgi:hypothetical protein
MSTELWSPWSLPPSHSPVNTLSLLCVVQEDGIPGEEDQARIRFCSSRGCISSLCRSCPCRFLTRRFVKSLSSSPALCLCLSEEVLLLLSLSVVLNDFVPKTIRSVKRSHYSSTEEYKLALKDNRDATRYFNMYSMLDDKLNSIEIMWTGKGLFLVSFVMPRQSQFLTKVLRDKIINSIDYTDDDKVTVFLSKTRHTIAELNITMKLVDMHLHSLLLFQDELATAIFSLSVLINFLLVIGIEKGYFTGQDHPQYAEGRIRVAVTILVAIQCSLCLYRLFQTSLIRLPLAYEGD